MIVLSSTLVQARTAPGSDFRKCLENSTGSPRRHSAHRAVPGGSFTTGADGAQLCWVSALRASQSR